MKIEEPVEVKMNLRTLYSLIIVCAFTFCAFQASEYSFHSRSEIFSSNQTFHSLVAEDHNDLKIEEASESLDSVDTLIGNKNTVKISVEESSSEFSEFTTFIPTVWGTQLYLRGPPIS